MKAKFKDKQNLVFRIALALALVFVVLSAFQIKGELDADTQKLEELNDQIEIQQRENDELIAQSDDDGSFIRQLLEQAAYNKGYYRPGERVFKEVPGN